MSRRDFRTPANLPLETVGRCITVPNDAAWLGLLNAALLMLTEHWRYDQVETTDLTPEETAAIWYDIYVSTLTSACDDCPDMSCNDVLACIADAGYLLSSPNLPDDQRVLNGIPQVSFDGGTTWVDVAGDASAPPLVANPKPTSGANDAAKICLASSRATLVLAEFYKQTFGAFTADITNALGTFNNFLQELNSALLGLAYGQAAQMLNAEIMRGQDWETNYTAAELSSGNLEDLLCLLVDNASVDASGVVTFDYGAVRDNVIADVGINPGTALWFLLGNMQEAGLNAAGSVQITDTALDCNCGLFTLTALNGNGANGFTPIDWVIWNGCNGECSGVYDAVNDRFSRCVQDCSGTLNAGVRVRRSGFNATLTDITLSWLTSGNITDERVFLILMLDDVVVWSHSVSTVSGTLVSFPVPNVQFDTVDIAVRGRHNGSSPPTANINEIVLTGYGTT